MTDTTPTIRERLDSLGACPAGLRALADQGFDLDAPNPGLDQWAAWWRTWQTPGHPMRRHAGWLVGRLVPVERILGEFAGACLAEADLTGADLRGAYLRRAGLRGADLADADLTGADLSWAYLRGAVLRGADLADAVLRGAVLRWAVLRGADLRGAVLTGAVLRGADLTGAYRRPADAPIPGWTVIGGRLHRDTTETS